MTHGKFVRTLIILGLGTSMASFVPAQTPGMPPGQFQGSVPDGTATATPIALTLDDAIARGLRANLGLLTSEQSSQQTKAQKIGALAALLPKVTGDVSETVQQTNLKALGLNFPSSPDLPFQFPIIVGPFAYTDARANATVPLVNLSNWRSYRASRQRLTAAELNLKDARDLVVQAVGNAYLSIIASAARVDSTVAQVNTDQVLFDRASDQKKGGVAPGIDVLRAEVE